MAELHDLVVVFAGSVMDATIVKGLLESSDIDAVLLDEYVGTLAPWYVAPGGAGAVKVAVSQADLDQSQTVLAEISSKGSLEVEGKAWTCPKCGEAMEAQFGQCWSCQTSRPDQA